MQQTDTILIDSSIRLREINESDYDIALPWYQDMEALKGTVRQAGYGRR